MNKLCFLVRYLSSSSCLDSHLLNPNNPKPYFFIPTLPFSTTATTTRKPVALYLRERLGLSDKDSLAISKKLVCLRDVNRTRGDYQVTDLISFENADNVITFLQEYCGLVHLSHIKKVITKHPKILAADVDKTIKPKVTLLQDLGFTSSDLAHVLSRNPVLYLTTDLTPAIQVLRGIVGTDKDVVKVFRGLTYGTANNVRNNLIPNVTMLENEFGISKMRLRDFLCSRPKLLMLKTETIRDGIVKMEDKWSISRDSSEFVRALYVFYCFSDDNINSKCQVFRSFGWSDSDIMISIRKHPNCIGYAEARIRKVLEFFMNELGYKPAYMASRPSLFSRSLENRVVPRHRVLSILKEKGLIKDDYQLYNALFVTEDKFFERFILPYEKTVPELHQVYIDGGRSASEADVHMETSANRRKTPSAAE